MAIKTTWGNNDGLFVLGGEIADNRYVMAFTNQESQEVANNEPEPKTPVTEPEPQEIPEAETPKQESQDESTEQGNVNETEDTDTEADTDADDLPVTDKTEETEQQEQPENPQPKVAEQDSPPESIEPKESTIEESDDSEVNKELENPKNNKKQRKPLKHKKLLIGSLSTAILIALILGGWLYSRGRVLPNTYVANQKVAGLKQADLEKLINNKQKSFTITIKGKKKTLKPTKKDIGLTFATNQTVTNTMAVHRTGSFWQHIMWWQRTNINLSPKINQKELTKYLKANVKTATRKPQNAKLVFDTTNSQFKIEKQVLGSGILVSKAANQIVNSAQTANSIEVDVPTQALSAKITANNIKPTLADANSYIKTPINLKLKGATYSPSAAERASWLKFATNKTSNNYDIKVLPAQIKLYISGISTPFHQDVTQRITIKNKTTGVKTVLQNGLNGQDVNNQTQISAALTKAFTGQQKYTGDLKVTTTPYKTQDINALAKWAYISLTNQRLTAYRHDKPVKSFLISSGVAKYPTNVGVFKVWYKTPVQTMVGGSKASGDYYDLPHVHWDTYFDHDIAVHEAYWHNNFGHPMSHGCINATYADSEWFYKFAPIGTTVVVVQ